MRGLIILHRYLGIAVGALMVMWCLSGAVMMYVSYPALDERVRLAHLAPIDFDRCCALPTRLPDDVPVRALQVETVAGSARVHWRTTTTDGTSPAGTPSVPEATAVAQRYMAAGQTVMAPVVISFDQWTVSSEFDADRPLYRFDRRDEAGTTLYVSSTRGRVVQLTTRAQRIGNAFGAVPHWLYFSQLRHRPVLWTWVVIATSLAGTFLTTLGLWIGWVRWTHRGPARWSPYRGFNLWHHVAGLVFGLFTFTWILSGLLSMNPAGLLEGSGTQQERQTLAGGAVTLAQVRTGLRQLCALRPSNVVSLRLAPLAGTLFFELTDTSGRRERRDAQGNPAALSSSELAFIGRSLAGVAGQTPQWLTREDAYHFGHHGDPAPLPVYRVIAPATDIYYYVDPVTGALLAKFDAGSKGYRWWHQGLHRLDIIPALRQRPLWDLLMIVLLSGATLLCVTGSWLGLRRVLRRA